MSRNVLLTDVLLVFGRKWSAGRTDETTARPFSGDSQLASIPLVLDMVHHNPGEKRYISQFNDPELIKRMGYAGKVYFLFDSPMPAAEWQRVDERLMPEGSPVRKWEDDRARMIDDEIAACKRAGLKIYAMSDMNFESIGKKIQHG